jgi:hypothetical protein
MFKRIEKEKINGAVSFAVQPSEHLPKAHKPWQRLLDLSHGGRHEYRSSIAFTRAGKAQL